MSLHMEIRWKLSPIRPTNPSPSPTSKANPLPEAALEPSSAECRGDGRAPRGRILNAHGRDVRTYIFGTEEDVVMVSPEQLADVFVEIADTLIDDFDLFDFLHNLTDHAVAISGAASVGLMLADHQEALHYMAASSEAAEHLELYQLQHAEGPCLDCYATRQPVIVSDLIQAEDRWPDFVPRAIAAGMRSVHAVPMLVRDKVLGAFNVFGQEPLPLEPATIRIMQALARVATIAILQEQSLATSEALTEQLQGALNSRIVIEQANGVLSRDLGIGVEEAFVTLRQHARNNQLRLADLAHDVVNRKVAIHSLK
jgi:GAF domain-containing protein